MADKQRQLTDELYGMLRLERDEWRDAYIAAHDRLSFFPVRLGVHFRQLDLADVDVDELPAAVRLFFARIRQDLEDFAGMTPKLLTPHEMRAAHLSQKGDL